MILAFLFPTFREENIYDYNEPMGYMRQTLAYYSYDNILSLNILMDKTPLASEKSYYEECLNPALNEKHCLQSFDIENIIKESNSTLDTKTNTSEFATQFIKKFSLDYYLAFGCPITNDKALINGWVNNAKLDKKTLNKLLKVNSLEDFNNLLASNKLTEHDENQLELFARSYAQSFLEHNNI